MVDLKLLLANPEYFRNAVMAKGYDASIIDTVISLDKAYKDISTYVEELRAKRRSLGSSNQGSPEEGKEIKLKLKESEEI